MPKKKSYPYKILPPAMQNPLKEMSWCFSKHMYISYQIQGFKIGDKWEMGDKYKLIVRQGTKYSETDYIYTKDNVMEALYAAYIKAYNTNNGEKGQE
jgi:hypothetical protein